MYLLTMYWMLFHLLIATHEVMGFNENSMHLWTDHPLLQVIEKTYDVPLEITDFKIDVGKPLILTKFLKNNKTTEARKAARVDDTFLLPGIESYAGYLTVNEKHNGNLWFWYFPVPNKPVNETPLILWLQGGPGASSLYGLFEEIGPFTVNKKLKLHEKKYSWGKNHSLLFIDNPVGTGFSFTDADGYTTNQTTIGENLYTALQQFLTIFPELREAPLFIAGESYAGKHIPSLGIQIHWHKDQQQPINLQGLAIGNGLIDPVTLVGFGNFANEVGLVDDKTADHMKSFETEFVNYIQEGDLLEALWNNFQIMWELKAAANISNAYNYLSEKVEFFGSYTKLIEKHKIRRALHVGNIAFTKDRTVFRHLLFDIMNSAKVWLEELLDHYRVLVYSGHLDCVVPYHASVNTYQSLNYSGAHKYENATRYPWHHDGILAGYYKEGGNLLEVMVRGAGHMVPMDKPAQALGLITAFIQDITLDEDTGKLVN